MQNRTIRSGVAALAVAVALGGCSIPADPEGTLARAEGGTLIVGVTDNGNWVRLGVAEPEGLEPDLLRGFADEHDSTIEWVEGSEQELIDDLDRGQLAVVVGGFVDDTPWSDFAGMTRPYVETTDETGAKQKHVMLTRMGENALLFALDRWLLSEDVTL